MYILTFFGLFCSFILATEKFCSNNYLINSTKINSVQYYNPGDTLSIEDQNHSYNVCYSDGNYIEDSTYRFSDYSGNIILVSMNATW